jgi:hypothetical protein
MKSSPKENTKVSKVFSTKILIKYLSYLAVNEQSEDFTFEKKIMKLYKALRVMENAKHLEPKFSQYFKDLAYYFAKQRKNNIDGSTSYNMSRISKGDIETSSNFTGVNQIFGNVLGTNDRDKSLPNNLYEKSLVLTNEPNSGLLDPQR